MGGIKKINASKFGELKIWQVSSSGESRYNSNEQFYNLGLFRYLKMLFFKYSSLGYMVGDIRIIKLISSVDVEIYLYDWLYWDKNIFNNKKRVKFGERLVRVDAWFNEEKVNGPKKIYYSKYKNLVVKGDVIKNKVFNVDRRRKNLFKKKAKSYITRGYCLHDISKVINFVKKVRISREISDVFNKDNIIKKKDVDRQVLKKEVSSVTNHDLYRFIFLYKLVLRGCMKFFKKRVNLTFYLMNTELVTSFVLVYYLKSKLLNGEFLRFILNRLKYQYLDKLIKNKMLVGYYILCKGRYSKKSRGSQMKITGGKMSFSSSNTIIDYSSIELVLKYGKVNICIWLVREKRYKPYFYKLEV